MNNSWRILAFFILFFGISSVKAQEVTLKYENAPLQTVFTEIERQTKYVFFNNKPDIENIKVTVDLTNVSLAKALNILLAGKGLESTIFGKTIGIKKIPTAKNGTTEKGKKVIITGTGNIRGQVLDENQLPMEDAFVALDTTARTTYTNKNGDFEFLGITLPGTVTVSKPGFFDQSVRFTDSTALRVSLKRDKEGGVNQLAEVSIQSANNAITNPNKFVDLTNRSYMNLSQVLQGTVPGLTLQTATSTNRVVTSVDVFFTRLNNQVYQRFVRMSLAEFTALRGAEEAQRIINQLLAGRRLDGYILNTTTRTSTVLIPQVRGANGFTGSTDGMLVVIDGFPQEGFPANYPMSNVESVEVIKDPRELIKWGTRATAGLILIKTKVAKKGKITVNYSGNFNYEPAQKFDRQKLRLASTPEYLDYLKEADSVFQVPYTPTSVGFTPAQRLFAQRRQGLITPAQYEKTLDSLKGLDNEAQLQSMQQDRWGQNHTLGLSGGGSIYRFNLLGNYITEQSHDVKAYSKTLNVNLNNEFSLFKNKLNISWLINYSNELARTGTSLPANPRIEPYQMLTNDAGNYVYDYTDNFSPAYNDILLRNGYFNHGVNILEDARVNRNLSRMNRKKTNFTSNWNFLPGLTWSSSVFYDGLSNKTNQVNGKESSFTRQLVNSYGQYFPTGVNFYVPYGDVLQMNDRSATQLNIRSGFSYEKKFGKHQISMTVGGAASSLDNSRPNNATIYGYNEETGVGSPIFLPTPNNRGPIQNYYSLLSAVSSPTVYPYNLTIPLNGDTTQSRNLNGNAGLIYKFTDRLTISGTYNTILNSLASPTADYSQLTNQTADVTGLIFKKITRYVKNVSLSVGLSRVKMPDAPAVYNNTRSQQPVWGNYAIWINGAQPLQQQGQSSTTIYQKLTFGLLDSALTANVAYNTQRRNGNLQTLSTTPSALSAAGANIVTVRYLSAGLNALLRKSLLRMQLNYSRSPEGQSQLNGGFTYDIAHERYFRSKSINLFNVGFKMDDISSYQGLNIVMNTNVASNGSYSQAVNSNYSLLPPRNKSYELYTTMAMVNDTYTIDLRYYNRITSGLNNNTPSLVDPSTGLNSRTTYSTISNKGVEAFFRVRVVNTKDVTYQVTLNGAYNENIAKNVPDPVFDGSSGFTTMYRSGYDISNIWSVNWAGLNNQGNPQIYNANGVATAVLDTATVAGAMVYSGKARAPWTGGFIHDLRYKAFFMRTAITFNFGAVMRTYIPYPTNGAAETSILIKDRWRKPGDENFTDVPRMDGGNGSNLGFRSLVTQNGTNSILSANSMRLQELMIGCNLPATLVKRLGIEGCTIALSGQNLTSWNMNKYHIDPTVVDGRGVLGLPIPKQYSLNINVNF
ncbi:TonB-dependent receptor plug domain-containing protein [Pedobacter sp. MC2016-14]|uniref:SusC/RagA family TonB-linked outer membrane protein n=1 Tax=Pedobacter sp. MC2016-14 TaxID=2897327 RepID=UPI001E588F05|nr:SusC/RagA family TonB-linked outer membrane protein [Pedobacter sp. MC2016-14]MCD0487800.1 TonB-dependent receptor plug domain-containing protein [Pedobacter sp. MC2016-14]